MAKHKMVKRWVAGIDNWTAGTKFVAEELDFIETDRQYRRVGPSHRLLAWRSVLSKGDSGPTFPTRRAAVAAAVREYQTELERAKFRLERAKRELDLILADPDARVTSDFINLL